MRHYFLVLVIVSLYVLFTTSALSSTTNCAINPLEISDFINWPTEAITEDSVFKITRYINPNSNEVVKEVFATSTLIYEELEHLILYQYKMDNAACITFVPEGYLPPPFDDKKSKLLDFIQMNGLKT